MAVSEDRAWSHDRIALWERERWRFLKSGRNASSRSSMGSSMLTPSPRDGAAMLPALSDPTPSRDRYWADVDTEADPEPAGPFHSIATCQSPVIDRLVVSE
jgi:hypothetical protein